MEKVLAGFTWLSRERAIGNTNDTWGGCQLSCLPLQKKNLRVTNRALGLTLKVQSNVFLEKADRIDDAPILARIV